MLDGYSTHRTWHLHKVKSCISLHFINLNKNINIIKLRELTKLDEGGASLCTALICNLCSDTRFYENPQTATISENEIHQPVSCTYAFMILYEDSVSSTYM
jgi:hypothetical protein